MPVRHWLDLPLLGFEYAQKYAQGIANDFGHVLVSEEFADFGDAFPVSRGQSDGSWLQLKLDATFCSLASPLPRRFVSRLYTAGPESPCFPKPTGAIMPRPSPGAVSGFSGRCPDPRAERRTYQSIEGAI